MSHQNLNGIIFRPQVGTLKATVGYKPLMKYIELDLDYPVNVSDKEFFLDFVDACKKNINEYKGFKIIRQEI